MKIVILLGLCIAATLGDNTSPSFSPRNVQLDVSGRSGQVLHRPAPAMALANDRRGHINTPWMGQAKTVNELILQVNWLIRRFYRIQDPVQAEDGNATDEDSVTEDGDTAGPSPLSRKRDGF